MPRDVVSRTANVGTVGINGLSECLKAIHTYIYMYIYLHTIIHLPLFPGKQDIPNSVRVLYPTLLVFRESALVCQWENRTGLFPS